MIPNIDGLANFVTSTRRDQPKGEWTETLAYYDLPLIQYLVDMHGVDIDFGQGAEIRVRYRENVGFRMKGYYEANPAAKRETLTSYNIRPAHWEQQVAIDEKEHKLNQGVNQIVSALDIEYSGAYEAIANNLELQLVSTPQNATDEKAHLGLPAAIPTLALSAADPIGGFNGVTWYYADATPTTLYGGRDMALLQFSRLRSWAATYTDPSNEQFVQAFVRACIRTGFKRKSVQGLKGDTGASIENQVAFAPTTVYEAVENRVNRFEQSGGGDALGKYQQARIRSVPLVPTPILDTLAYAPVWCTRLGKKGLHYARQRGRFRNETPLKSNADSQDVLVGQVVGTGNLRNADRRGAGFCLHLVRTAA